MEMSAGKEKINPKKVGFHWPKGDLLRFTMIYCKNSEENVFNHPKRCIANSPT